MESFIVGTLMYEEQMLNSAYTKEGQQKAKSLIKDRKAQWRKGYIQYTKPEDITSDEFVFR